jgi:ribosomal protein L37AE/L43A
MTVDYRFDSAGSEANFQSHSSALSSSSGQGAGINLAELLTTQEVKDMNLGQDKADYFSTRIIVTLIKTENLSYPACPSEGCNKKVTEMGDAWKCEKCERTYERPEYRSVHMVRFHVPMIDKHVSIGTLSPFVQLTTRDNYGCRGSTRLGWRFLACLQMT